MLWHEHLRRSVKLLVLGVAHYAGVLGWMRRRTRHDRALVLMYHRVTPRGHGVADYSPNGISVTPEEFEWQMQFLRRHYTIVPLSEIVAAVRDHRPFSASFAAVTFDDGWRDVHEFALPVLRRHAIPATVYLTTGFVDQEQWFWEERFKYLLALLHQAVAPPDVAEHDRRSIQNALDEIGFAATLATPLDRLPALLLRFGREMKTWSAERRTAAIVALERLVSEWAADAPRPFMNWNEVRDLVRCGIEIGNHTMTHHDLSGLPLEQALGEIGGAAERLQECLGAAPVDFAYPYGKYNEQIRAALTTRGVRSATTTRHGLVRAGSDPYALNRVNICSDVSAYVPLFAGRALGI